MKINRKKLHIVMRGAVISGFIFAACAYFLGHKSYDQAFLIGGIFFVAWALASAVVNKIWKDE